MKKIIRKTLGIILLANFIPLISLLSWRITPSDYIKYKWYIPYLSGFIGDVFILVCFGIFMLAALLLTDD